MNIVLKFLVISFMGLSLFANVDTPKQSLQAGYILNYMVLPSKAEKLSDIFLDGMIYGRLRSNWFFHQYQDQDKAGRDNLNILGVGGSLIYKTASYAGFSTTIGAYYTSAGTGLDNQTVLSDLRSGKDVISRYNAVNARGKSFAVLAQSYMQYEHASFQARLGREIFNSFFTKSNDSKMIPNTFEGLTLESKAINKTRLRAGYLRRQKLRDHDNFHSTIMYDDRNTNKEKGNTSWNENDDTAVHRGLNFSNFEASGIDKNPDLFIIDAYTRAIYTKDLIIKASGMYIKDLYYTAMLEINYTFDLGNGCTLSPGIRYVQQFDDGAGAIGGASLSGKAAKNTASSTVLLDQNVRKAYTNPDSVNTNMQGARLVLKKGPSSLSLGYTKIADKADFITPWRGFITSGYTREMARYNWIANTKTYRLRGSFDFSKANIIEGLRSYASFTFEDYDEEKFNNKFDSYLYYLGFIKDLKGVPNLSLRMRAQWVDIEDKEISDNGQLRLEMNYLF